MEQDLNTYKNDDFETKNYFQTEFRGQNIANNLEFKNWLEGAKNYIKKENERRKESYIRENYLGDISILTIEFCDKCLCYTLCSLENEFSYIKCNKCHEEFCIGCSRKRQMFDEYNGDISVCLKGYLKGFFLRIINRRSELVVILPLFHIIHIIFCLLITPLFLGFISNFMGLIVHPNKKRIIKNDFQTKICPYFIYSICRGLLMFPYIILFLPFMIILLLPSIFSYTYYLYIFVSYIAAVWPGCGPLTNVGEH